MKTPIDAPVTTHARKPDPDEPWRYVCPDCGGQPQRGRNADTFQCSTCNRAWDRDDLVDLKEAE